MPPDPPEPGRGLPSRLTVGTRALLLQLDDEAAVLPTYERVRRLVERGDLPAPRDLVPAARTILVDGVAPDDWWSALVSQGVSEKAAPAADPDTEAADLTDRSSGQVVTIPIRYDGEDLDEVASQWGWDRDEVVRRHVDAEFTVAFCGFAPGFAYCTSDPTLPGVNRRPDPRTKVPAGAVGLAGTYCGVYPTAMPGGWQLIGTTSATMFDPGRERPALVAPGDRIRFEVNG